MSKKLIELVTALSKEERRYYTLHSNKYGSKQSMHYTLFETIKKHGSQGISKFMSNHASDLTKPKANFVCHHLYKDILHVLSTRELARDYEQQVRSLIIQVKLLFRKQLYDQALKLITQGLKQCYKHQLILEELQLLDWKRRIRQAAQDVKAVREHYELDTERSLRLTQVYGNLIHLRALDSRVFLFNKTDPLASNETATQEASRLLEDSIALNEKEFEYDEEVILHNQIRQLCNYALNQKEESLQYSGNLVKFYETKISEAPHLVNKLVYALRNHIAILTELEHTQQAEENIAKMQQLVQHPSVNLTQLQLFTHLLALNLYVKVRNPKPALEIIPRAQDFIDAHKQSVNKHHAFLFYYLFAQVHFHAGDFKSSLREVNRILEENNALVRKDLLYFSRIFNLILHFELRNYDHLEYLLMSTYKFFYKWQRKSNLNKILIRNLRRVVTQGQEANLHQFFEQFHSELVEGLTTKEDLNYLQYFDVIAWTREKAESR